MRGRRSSLLLGYFLLSDVLWGAEPWFEKIEVAGDLRYRHEMIDEEGAKTRNRHRIRARVSAAARVNEELKAVIGLASGSGDPVSSNQTLGDGASSKDIRLDLAYFDWTPPAMKGLHILGGKMKNPFKVVSDLVWDGDLRPEGLVATWTMPAEEIRLKLKSAMYWFEERKASDDTILYAGQVVLGTRGSPWRVLVGASYYYWDNMEGYGTLADSADDPDGFGNSTVEVTEPAAEPGAEPKVVDLVYATGFQVVEGFAKLGWKFGDVPVKVFGQYAVNTEADTEDTGYLVGIGIGKAEEPGQVEVGYDYRRLERDAVVGAFCDSDSFGGGTDGKGHRFKAKLVLSRHWTAGVTYLMDEAGLGADSRDYDRLQVDLVARF